MKPKVLNRFGIDDRGAVAATYAISLFALVAVAGVAFDYARLAGMDSELQNGADQAALAGVTQLDKEDGACARATNAAIALLNNETLLANDVGERSVQINSGNTITIADDACTGTTGIQFWQDKEKNTPATTDETAAYLEVTVDARIAEYAFTPIVGALNSGNVASSALAGLGSAICKVPPLMICSPIPGVDFDAAARVGWGVKATAHGGAGGTWAPGTFGFLEVGQGALADLAVAIAFEDSQLNCAPIEGTTPETGNAQILYNAINTRFDVYDFSSGSGTTLAACHSGECPPSPNSTKDLIKPNTSTGGNSCKIHNSGWQLPTNRFRPGTRDTTSGTAGMRHDDDLSVDAMGLTRDLCHYNSYGFSCNSTADPTAFDGGGTGLSTNDPNSRFGRGYWARGDYFNQYHGDIATVFSAIQSAVPKYTAEWNPATWTRYETYLWEQGKLYLQDSDNDLVQVPGGIVRDSRDGSYGGQYGRSICQPSSSGPPDRRVLTVAVVKNCSSLTGGSVAVDVDEWVDMFLVEPVVDDSTERANGRGSDVIYMEVIRPATVGNNSGGGGPQNVRRDVPYLIE